MVMFMYDGYFNINIYSMFFLKSNVSSGLHNDANGNDIPYIHNK